MSAEIKNVMVLGVSFSSYILIEVSNCWADKDNRVAEISDHISSEHLLKQALTFLFLAALHPTLQTQHFWMLRLSSPTTLSRLLLTSLLDKMLSSLPFRPPISQSKRSLLTLLQLQRSSDSCQASLEATPQSMVWRRWRLSSRESRMLWTMSSLKKQTGCLGRRFSLALGLTG